MGHTQKKYLKNGFPIQPLTSFRNKLHLINVNDDYEKLKK